LQHMGGEKSTPKNSNKLNRNSLAAQSLQQFDMQQFKTVVSLEKDRQIKDTAIKHLMP